MPSGTPSNRSQLLLSFVAIRRDSCEGSGRTSTANAELARQLGRSRKQGKGDTFLCGRRGHLPYQKMTAFFGLGGIGWSSIWVQNSDGGQIVESTPSRPRCYYLVLKADAGSVPCSTFKGQMAETVDFGPKEGTSVQATERNRTVLRPAPSRVHASAAHDSRRPVQALVRRFAPQLPVRHPERCSPVPIAGWHPSKNAGS